MVTNMKLAFTNVLFRHNLACVIQKWLRFKSATTVRLAYISKIFPNGSKIIQLLFTCELLKKKLLKKEVLNDLFLF